MKCKCKNAGPTWPCFPGSRRVGVLGPRGLVGRRQVIKRSTHACPGMQRPSWEGGTSAEDYPTILRSLRSTSPPLGKGIGIPTRWQDISATTLIDLRLAPCLHPARVGGCLPSACPARYCCINYPDISMCTLREQPVTGRLSQRVNLTSFFGVLLTTWCQCARSPSRFRKVAGTIHALRCGR